MIENYLKVALRNILKYKFFSAINILGMTIGITSCLLLLLYVKNELSFDQFHTDGDRIYQVALHGKLGGQDLRIVNTPPPMAQALVADIPGVESSLRILKLYQSVVKNDDKAFTEDRVYFTDSNFFDFFSYRLIEGDPKTALKDPNTMVLTPEMSRKYFGEENPIGKLLTVGTQNEVYKVTGIAESPANSHFIFNVLLSVASDEDAKSQEWLSNYIYTYFKLRPNARLDQVTDKFEPMVEKYVGPEMEKYMGMTIKQMHETGGEYGYYVTNVKDIHLHSTSLGDIEPGGNVMYIYFFIGIGAFIIIIACINFMNLSTARSAGRAKEVGLRKTLGSLRAQMIIQFLSESMIYSFTAVILSLVAVYFLLPTFNLLSGKDLGLEIFKSAGFVISVVALAIGAGVIAGSYPAFYLTSFSSVEVLKGKVRSGMKSKGIRSALVVVQFALSIFLIIFTVIVYQQIQFMQEKNLGIDKSNVLMIKSANRLGNNKEAFRNSLNQQSGVLKVSYSNNTFPGVNNTSVFKSVDTDQDHIMGIYKADYNHQEVMRFELTAGRYFSEEFPSDSSAVLLNEAAVRELGFENPLGSEVMYTNNSPTFKKFKVIGVIKNFNFESFKEQVRPLAILLTKNSNNLLIRYEGSPKEVVANAEKLWKQQSSSEPFEYAFLDESFDKLFRAEERMGQLFSIFSGLTIFIACLGLFALAAFTSEQRTKEIGIRKSMGASSTSLTLLLSREFTLLVLIAFVPAAVTAWYVSNTWLQSFAYRVPINPLVFVLSGLAAIVIAWLTVSYQSIKASAANPVDSLRYE